MKSEYNELFLFTADAFPDLSFCIIENRENIIYRHIIDPSLSPEDFTGQRDAAPEQNRGSFLCSVPIRHGIHFTAITGDQSYSRTLPILVRTLFNHYQNRHSGAVNDNSFFFQYLMYSDTFDEISCLSLLPDNQEYDFSEPRLILLMEISRKDHKSLQDDLGMSVLAFIRRHPSVRSKDIIGLLSPSQIVICKTLSESFYPLRRRYSEIFGALTRDITDAFGVSLQTAVSFTAENMNEYPFCIRTADLLLSLKEKHDSSDDQTVFAADAFPELLLHNLPYDALAHYFGGYNVLLKKHADWYETLEALVRTNMNITEAAKELYMHKNSLLFRIRNMLEGMRLPTVKNDSVKFFLLLLYHYHQMNL